MSTGAKFVFALVALAAAMLAGWQLAAYYPPSEYQFAGWMLFATVALGSAGVAIL